MKTTTMYALMTLLLFGQACTSTQEESNEKAESTEVKLDGLANLEQRRSLQKEDSTMIANKRMRAWKQMVEMNTTYTDQQGTVIYHKAEVNPVYVGGNPAMMKFLRGNIVYPKQAEKDELEGTVFVDFVIGVDGTVSNVEVTNATSVYVDRAFREEAVRLVSSMPKWTPGSQNNTPVNVKYSIPVSFRII